MEGLGLGDSIGMWLLMWDGLELGGVGGGVLGCLGTCRWGDCLELGGRSLLRGLLRVRPREVGSNGMWLLMSGLGFFQGLRQGRDWLGLGGGAADACG